MSSRWKIKQKKICKFYSNELKLIFLKNILKRKLFKVKFLQIFFLQERPEEISMPEYCTKKKNNSIGLDKKIVFFFFFSEKV